MDIITNNNVSMIGLITLVVSTLLTAMSQVFNAKQVQEVRPFLF
ncbi:hypothetical protein [Lysinibacillus mangiferihumi]|nr:hypothetical protein [Lysinibacillus mangiferihumi]